MLYRRTLLLCALLASGTTVSALDKEFTVLDHREELFKNKECKKTKTCDLKQARFVVENYKVGVHDGVHYGTRLFALYETDRVSALEKYVFVQFIRGCQFSSMINNGVVLRSFSFEHRHFGVLTPFKYADWVIDTDNTDPVYSAMEGYKSRHTIARWNEVPGSFDPATQRWYVRRKPVRPELYVTDRPGTAFFWKNEAKNISLQFRMCLYRAKDIPRKFAPGKTLSATPLTCFEWDSSFVYEHGTGEFNRPTGIVQECSDTK